MENGEGRRRRSAPNVRREQILDGAEQSLLDLGWAGTTFSTIAERSGVARSALNYFFADKQAIMQAVVARLFERATAGIDQLTSLPVRDPVRVLQSIRRRLMAPTAGELRMVQLLLACWSAGLYDPAIRQQLTGYFQFFRGRLELVLAAGSAQGVLRVDDPTAAAGWLLASVHGLLMQHLYIPNRELTRRAAADLFVQLGLEEPAAAERANQVPAGPVAAEKA
jgi:AcrR family transcriptional regulator